VACSACRARWASLALAGRGPVSGAGRVGAPSVRGELVRERSLVAAGAGWNRVSSCEWASNL